MGKRVGILDEARGLAVISMVIYHLYFDLRYFYGIDMGGLTDTVMHAWQPFIAGTFIVVSGIASRYSSNNIRRGALTLMAAMCFTFATAFVTPSAPITFGILHLLGTCMVLYGFVGKWTERLPSAVGMLLFTLLFVFSRGIPDRAIRAFGIEGFFSVKMPAALYNAELLFPLGFPSDGYAAMDYFPLLPYFFLFLAGASLGTLFRSGKVPNGFYTVRFSALARIGRHALLIYILHQPILVAVQEIVFKLIGRPTMFL